MSVINKMLKDLEQRQEPETNGTFSPASAEFKPSNSKKQTLTLTALSAIILVLTVAVVWLFIDKDGVVQAPVQSKPQQFSEREAIEEAKSESANSTIQTKDTSQPQKVVLDSKARTETQAKEQQLAKVFEQTNNDMVEKTERFENAEHIESNYRFENEAPLPNVKSAQNVEPTKPTRTEPARVQIVREEKPDVTAPTLPSPEKTLARKEVKGSSAQPQTEKSVPTFRIEKSSTILTKEQRITKLMAQAQKSFDQGYITESISQLKEVLAADDANVDARNLLAVAWYGRGENQMAVTILNDGLSRYPRVEKWRITAAKMFFKENNPAGAFSYLEADLTSASTEYYTMKGTLARQLQRFDKAESAYSMLTQLQPNIGNWWLGYAIALDSQSKSELALQSYKMVLEKGGVSPATLSFAQQRIQELQG